MAPSAEPREAGLTDESTADEVFRSWSPRTARAADALPDAAGRAMAQGYLCMRGLDEIEDHRTLPRDRKIVLLRALADAFREGGGLDPVLAPHVTDLPIITVGLAQWRCLADEGFRPRIDTAMASLADRMADWAERSWRIGDATDLYRYCWDVAVTLFLVIDDVLVLADGVQPDRRLTIPAAMAVQIANIAAGQRADGERGVTFVPPEWDEARLMEVVRAGRADVRRYVEQSGPGPRMDSLSHLFGGFFG